MANSVHAVLAGDEINVVSPFTGEVRRLLVAEVNEAGVAVSWFTPDGLGPFSMILPHAEVEVLIGGGNEKGGQMKHYTKTHPDWTGNYGWY